MAQKVSVSEQQEEKTNPLVVGQDAEKDAVVKDRLARVQAGIEDAKRKKRQEERERAKKAKVTPPPEDDLDGLYGSLPPPDPEKDAAMAARAAAKAASRGTRLPPLPPPDNSKVIFLDVDGVLRPLTAGGFRQMMIDGEFALQADTSDFMASALLGLRHIIENTGAVCVLSSEWRRDEVMRKGVDDILREYEMPPCITWTPTDLPRDMGTDNPFQAFTERRAREISAWMNKNSAMVQQWVVLDDINMANADQDRRPGTLRMTERIVQTHRKIGLTLENGHAAVRLLRGEKLPPQILEDQPHVELI